MATFVVAVGNTAKIHEMVKKLSAQQHADPSEYVVRDLSTTTSLFIVAKEVSKQLDRYGGDEFFSGWMIDHAHNAVYLGLQGFHAAHRLHDGTDLERKEGGFLHAKWDSKGLVLTHDCFGLYPILSYHEADLFVASDSLLTLANIRTMMNLENEINSRVHSTRAWKHGLAQCIMSTETIVKGIEYLPPASSIRVRFTDTPHGPYGVQVEKNIPNMKRLFSKPSQPYAEVLVRGTKEIVGTVKAIQGIKGIAMELGLSGGLDSRVLLACIRKGKGDQSNVFIRSNRHSISKNDLSVVKTLAANYNFSFNMPAKESEKTLAVGRKRIKIPNMFAAWACSNLGLFDMMYMYPSHWNHPSIVEVGGHGAEIMKGTFAKTSLFKSAFRYRHPLTYLRIRKEIKMSLHTVGVPFYSKNKMQWHHLCYKSALQNGRTLPRNLVSLRPFLNMNLCSFGLHQPKNTLLNDMLILLDEGMASMPFDEPSKNMSKEAIEARKGALKGLKIPSNIPAYTVFGTMENIFNGTPSLLLESVSGFESVVGDHREAVRNKTNQIWRQLENPKMKHLYGGAYSSALGLLSSKETYMPRAGSPAAKIISLGMTNAVAQQEHHEDGLLNTSRL